MDSGKLHSESKTKAEIILKQFSSVFVRSNSTTMPPVKLRVQDGIQSIKIVSEGVERLLLNIQSHKGPDKYTKPSPQLDVPQVSHLESLWFELNCLLL